MRRRTEDVSHLMSACLGMKVRGGGMACRSGRVDRSGWSGLSCRSVRRPCALPQSARALAAPSESVGCVDGAARARISRKTLLEDRQCPARTISRRARDLTKFVFAHLNLVW